MQTIMAILGHTTQMSDNSRKNDGQSSIIKNMADTTKMQLYRCFYADNY